MIRGNLIISIGVWNTQVGNMCWDDVEVEKRKVYGNQIMDFALSSVKACCQEEGVVYGIYILLPLLIICTFIAIFVCNNYEFVKSKFDTCVQMCGGRNENQ